jgi:hypothetical protein
VIHKESVHEGHRVNSAFYVEVIESLLKRIFLVRPQFQAEDSYDNVPSHSALVVNTYLARNSVVEMRHRCYSPDLAPVDILIWFRIGTSGGLL